jgi:hypothetical protein
MVLFDPFLPATVVKGTGYLGWSGVHLEEPQPLCSGHSLPILAVWKAPGDGGLALGTETGWTPRITVLPGYRHRLHGRCAISFSTGLHGTSSHGNNVFPGSASGAGAGMQAVGRIGRRGRPSLGYAVVVRICVPDGATSCEGQGFGKHLENF